MSAGRATLRALFRGQKADMQGWINKRIETASWVRFFMPFAALIAYSLWAFRPSGQFLQAKKTAGTLPEEMFGFPEGEPERAFSQLFGLTGDYMLFQAIDIPYAILNFFAYSAIIALALKHFRFGATPLRFALLLPVIYLIAEFIENTMLVVLARGGGAAANLIPFQQAATSLKWAAGFPATMLAVLSLFAMIILFAIKLFRGKPA